MILRTERNAYTMQDSIRNILTYKFKYPCGYNIVYIDVYSGWPGQHLQWGIVTYCYLSIDLLTALDEF